MNQNNTQVQGINYFKDQYPEVLREMARNFDELVAKGFSWKYGKAINIVNNAMWLIECEETNVPEQPYCIYYHESGNVFGWTSFKDQPTFLEACKKFLDSTWGIKSE